MELKVCIKIRIYCRFWIVPNLPCGVESFDAVLYGPHRFRVPNLPCGVESTANFAMTPPPSVVPNLPCGVESVFNNPSRFSGT